MSGVIIFIVLLLSQVTLSVPNSFSLGSASTIPALVIMSAVSYSLFGVWQLVRWNTWNRLTKVSRYLILLLALLALGYIIVLLFRISIGDNRVSITLTSLMAVGVLIFALCDLEKVAMEKVIISSATFLNLAHIFLLAVIIAGGDIRTSMLFTNINVYNAAVVLLYPLLIYFYGLFRRSGRKLSSTVIFANLVAIPAVTLFSGSRFGVWCLFLSAAITAAYLLRSKIYDRRELRWMTTALVISISVIVSVVLVSPSLRQDAGRALFLTPSGYETSPEVAEKPASSETPSEVAKKPAQPETPTSEISSIGNEEPKNDSPTEPVKMLNRPWLYQEGLADTIANPILGTGASLVYMEGWGMQPPHNYFLEVFLTYGIPLGLLCIIILFTPVVHFIRRANNSPVVWLGLVGFFSLFLFAMVQPILTEQILIAVLVWLVFGAINVDRSR